MSKLDRLFGKSEVLVLEDIELDIKPLKVKDLQIFLDMGETEKRATALEKLIRKVLKEAIPDTTDEEIDAVSLAYFPKLTEVIMRVNGLEDKMPK